VAATTVGPPSALNAVECHPTPDRWFTDTGLDANCDCPDSGPDRQESRRTATGAYPRDDLDFLGISLESQDYFEQLEIIFFPL
jgi:hypothetical protein